MIYLGALSHGDERLALHRDGDLIHWEAAWRGSSTGPPRRAHDAIEQWITSVTDDWTEQAELRRLALDIRYLIDTPSAKCYLDRANRKEQSHE